MHEIASCSFNTLTNTYFYTNENVVLLVRSQSLLIKISDYLPGGLSKQRIPNSLRGFWFPKHQLLISHTWDGEVKELWPLQVTENTGNLFQVETMWMFEQKTADFSLFERLPSSENKIGVHIKSVNLCKTKPPTPPNRYGHRSETKISPPYSITRHNHIVLSVDFNWSLEAK